MSTHSYDRKTYFGGYADAMQGIPNLMVSIEAAFPGYSFVVRSFGPITNIVFDEDLDPDQILELDAVYAAWDPESTPPVLSLPSTTQLTKDVSTTSPNFVSLLAMEAMFNSGVRTLYAELVGECAFKTASLEFQVLVDGNPVVGSSIFVKGFGGATCDVELSEGAHTIEVKWRVSSGVAKIMSVSNALHHALLRIT